MRKYEKFRLNFIPFVCCLACMLVSCQKINKQHVECAKTVNCASSEDVKSQFVELANAIKERDCGKLKTFFVFPVNNQQIWYKVLSDDELESKSITEPFTDKDFDMYCSKFFDTDLEKTIGTFNFKELSFSNGRCVSDTVAVMNGIYLNKCVLSIEINDKRVTLSVISNLYDEHNDFLSEHIDRYYFSILKYNLQFSNFEMID